MFYLTSYFRMNSTIQLRHHDAEYVSAFQIWIWGHLWAGQGAWSRKLIQQCFEKKTNISWNNSKFLTFLEFAIHTAERSLSRERKYIFCWHFDKIRYLIWIRNLWNIIDLQSFERKRMSISMKNHQRGFNQFSRQSVQLVATYPRDMHCRQPAGGQDFAGPVCVWVTSPWSVVSSVGCDYIPGWLM